MTKAIAIIAGEPNSISSEIIFKSWKLKKKFISKPLFIIGSIRLLNLQMKKLKYNVKIKEIYKNFKIKELNDLKFPDLKNLKIIKNTVNLKTNSKKAIYPILTTNYDREYFISDNGKIRATIDYNLKSVYLKNLSQLDIVKNFSLVCILELKYSTKLDEYVRKNLKNITLRLSKNSKFVKSAFETPIFFS